MEVEEHGLELLDRQCGGAPLHTDGGRRAQITFVHFVLLPYGTLQMASEGLRFPLSTRQHRPSLTEWKGYVCVNARSDDLADTQPK